jgi:hypothetical protein
MEFDKLTEEEKQQYISEAVKTHSEYEPNFSFEKLKSEIESSEYNEYIEWESKFIKQCKDIGYISSNSQIQGETCDFCRNYNEHKIFESQSKLLKHLTICKYNPNNQKNAGNISYNCKYCNEYMGNKYNLDLHESKCVIVHSDDKFKELLCQYCSQYCKAKYKKYAHELTCSQNPTVIEKTTCKHCNRLMGNEYNLKKHEEKCQFEHNYLANTLDFKKITCQYCNYLSKSEHKKMMHELTCSQNPTVIEKTSCKYCNNVMETENNLKRHELVCRLNPMIIEKLTCKSCNKFMMNEYNFNVHTIKCIPLVKCKHCQKILKSQLLMPTHLENCDAYINHLQSIKLPINLDDVPDIDLNILIKNALK